MEVLQDSRPGMESGWPRRMEVAWLLGVASCARGPHCETTLSHPLGDVRSQCPQREPRIRVEEVPSHTLLWDAGLGWLRAELLWVRRSVSALLVALPVRPAWLSVPSHGLGAPLSRHRTPVIIRWPCCCNSGGPHVGVPLVVGRALVPTVAMAVAACFPAHSP